jgi:hypothetical protein
MSTPVAAPKLTMPAEEAAALRAAYQGSTVILEYGSGGSTVMAAEMAGKTVFSVESDASWLDNMRSYFDENPPAAKLYLHHGDIGPTRTWGHPLDHDDFRQWPDYPTQIWTLPNFVQPDVVLIDGRFRVACLLTTLFCTKAPVTAFVDDYIDRPNYKIVETLITPVAMHGRMARFELTPTAIPAEKLGWIVQRFLQTA